VAALTAAAALPDLRPWDVVARVEERLVSGRASQCPKVSFPQFPGYLLKVG